CLALGREFALCVQKKFGLLGLPPLSGSGLDEQLQALTGSTALLPFEKNAPHRGIQHQRSMRQQPANQNPANGQTYVVPRDVRQLVDKGLHSCDELPNKSFVLSKCLSSPRRPRGGPPGGERNGTNAALSRLRLIGLAPLFLISSMNAQENNHTGHPLRLL